MKLWTYQDHLDHLFPPSSHGHQGHLGAVKAPTDLSHEHIQTTTTGSHGVNRTKQKDRLTTIVGLV